ncbi:MAG TPA: aldehyde oxidase [Sphaerochaeta sp.]|jgi:xanthine dehydrogenase molybdopterin-binding subunit B|nr:aldehyde oxidase [Sphaerochaeta sp.]
MADKREPIYKANLLHGIVITSVIESGKISEIKMPTLDNNYVLIATRDIPGTNRIRVLDNATSLLTSSQISYRKQPILALFGYDSESVQLKSREIEISYEESSEASSSNISSKSEQIVSSPFTYRYGNMEAATSGETLVTMEHTYRYSGTGYTNSNLTRISVDLEEDKLHVYLPTQWPAHVRETISEVTTFPKKRIIIHRLPFYAPHDEMLIGPTALAAIASVAAIKAQGPVQLQCKIENYRPEVTIERKSWYYPEGKPHAEAISVSVDQGSAPMFTEEMSNQLIAGLVPIYPLDAISVSITFKTSNNPPAHFFGDLGYCDALASTESHYNEIARLTGYTSYAWRLKFASENNSHLPVIKFDKLSKLKDIITDVATRSDFQRKSAAYELQQNMKIRLSTFFNYSRGAAMACGPGISGFSSECKGLPQQSVQVQLNPNNKVECNTSFYTNGASSEIWKQIICEELGVEKGNISFPKDEQEMLDSGPSVLSANSGRMPQQIQRACAQIKEKRFVQPLPICESVLNARMGGAKGSLFLSNSWVALALELEIQAVTLQPMVRNIWVTISTGKVFDEHALRSKIRQTIVSTLREGGALLSSDKSFTIDIVIKEEGDQISSSVTSALKGLATAAYVSALQQALGSHIPQVPVTGEIILDVMRSNK